MLVYVDQIRVLQYRHCRGVFCILDDNSLFCSHCPFNKERVAFGDFLKC